MKKRLLYIFLTLLLIFFVSYLSFSWGNIDEITTTVTAT